MKTKYIAGICAAAVPMLAACSSMSSPSVRASDYPSSTTVPPAGTARPAQLAGSLTKPIGSYTGDEFNTFVTAIPRGGGHSRPRKCKHFYNCLPGFGKTDVTITSTVDAMYLNQTDADPNGTVAAVIDGVHHDTDGYPFLKNDRYAFIIYPAPASGKPATWTLEQIEMTGGVYKIDSVASGVFHECTKGGRLYWASSSADFQECGVVPHPNPAPTSSTRMDMMGFTATKTILGNLALLFAAQSSSWVTCEAGCCTMDAL